MFTLIPNLCIAILNYLGVLRSRKHVRVIPTNMITLNYNRCRHVGVMSVVIASYVCFKIANYYLDTFLLTSGTYLPNNSHSRWSVYQKYAPIPLYMETI